jgi:hypothetical protein
MRCDLVSFLSQVRTPPTCTPLRPGLRAKGCLSASELPYDLCFTTWPPGIGHATCPRRLLIALQRLHLAPRPRPRPLHARCPTSCALPPPLPHAPPALLPRQLSHHAPSAAAAPRLPSGSPPSSARAARQPTLLLQPAPAALLLLLLARQLLPAPPLRRARLSAPPGRREVRVGLTARASRAAQCARRRGPRGALLATRRRASSVRLLAPGG